MRKAWLLLLIFNINPIFAEVCPNVSAIQQNHLTGWLAFDTDTKQALTRADWQQFKHLVKEFALAEWDKTGSIHCIYHDEFGSDLNVYLSKSKVIPDNSKHVWYQVGGYQECAADMENCQFKALINQKKLARN